MDSLANIRFYKDDYQNPPICCWDENQVLRVSTYYLALRPFALASPLPRVPRTPPRAAPPLPAGAILPRLKPAIRDGGAGVANFGVAFEEVGGLSTNEVSVVINVVSPSISP